MIDGCGRNGLLKFQNLPHLVSYTNHLWPKNLEKLQRIAQMLFSWNFVSPNWNILVEHLPVIILFGLFRKGLCSSDEDSLSDEDSEDDFKLNLNQHKNSTVLSEPERYFSLQFFFLMHYCCECSMKGTFFINL